MLLCLSLHLRMTTRRKYKQLKLSMEAKRKQYDEVQLSFMLNRQRIDGKLKGSYQSWVFVSGSVAFLNQVPHGQLSKYAFWPNGVPATISHLYNGIWEAALKAGYDLSEEE